jgi:long-chain fatty acid transport protein
MKKILPFLSVFALLLLVASPLYAGGFGITEKGVKGQGSSFAGGAAAAEDASTIYWNPAGMTRLENNEADLAVFLIKPSFEFNIESATNVLGQPIQPAGADGGDAGFTNVVPNVFVSYNFNDKWFAGLGVVVPFGLGTEYDDNWVGRYHTVKSDILTIDINPSVAYRINDQWSVGGGISVQYLDAELTNAVDFGLIDATQLGGAFGLTPSTLASDGLAKLEGDSWGYGFNLGVMFELSDKTRFGFSYRSEIEQDVEGNTSFTDPATAPGISNLTLGGTQGSKATIDLPATASLSGFHMLNQKWGIFGDLTWTGWSSLKELRIVSDGGAPTSVTTLNWDDTWRLAAGANWYYSDAWTFRTGLAYDPTPVPNAEDRTPRVPDEDRLWLSVGTTWTFASAWSLDLAGTYIWTLDDPRLNKQTNIADPTNENNSRGNLVGSYDAYSIILGAQINFKF